MTEKEQEIFDSKWAKFLEEFKKVRKKGNMSRTDKEIMIDKYDLFTTNGLITYKKLSKLLEKNKILSDRGYKTKLIERGFLFMIRRHPRDYVVASLAKRFETDANSINGRLRKLGLRDRSAAKSKEWQIKAKEMYENGDTLQAISEKLNQPSTNVFAFLRHYSGLDLSQDYGVRGIKILYRDLQKPTVENSHLEGFVWADGTVQAGNEVAISISIDDKDFLNALSSSLVSSGEGPKVSKIKTKLTSERFSHKDRVGFTIARKSYATYLKNLGMPQNKEKTSFGFPQYIYDKSENFWAFLRGFFEGDGTITSDQISLCVNLKQAEELNSFLTDKFGFSGHITRDKSIFRLSFGSIPQTMFLIAGMYSAEGIYMDRKRRRSKNTWTKHYNKLDLAFSFDELPQLTIEQLHQEVFKVLQSKMKAWKYNITAMNRKTDETFSGTKLDFLSKTGLKISYVTRVERGDREHTGDWVITHSEKYSK